MAHAYLIERACCISILSRVIEQPHYSSYIVLQICDRIGTVSSPLPMQEGNKREDNYCKLADGSWIWVEVSHKESSPFCKVALREIRLGREGPFSH